MLIWLKISPFFKTAPTNPTAEPEVLDINPSIDEQTSKQAQNVEAEMEIHE